MSYDSENEMSSAMAVSISVITATYNAANQLPDLIASLKSQTDKDFEWIIADGESSDETLPLLREVKDLNITISSQADFGIYDALNRGIRLAKGNYYVVIGADDTFSPDAIARYKNAACVSKADIVTATVLLDGEPLTVREGQSWRYGINGFISAHSVGTLIKKSLHEKFGEYSHKFPIAADQFFITRACQNGARRHVVPFVAGNFNAGGVSTTDRLGTQLELYRVQLLTGQNKYIQTALLCIWLIKFCFKNLESNKIRMQL